MNKKMSEQKTIQQHPKGFNRRMELAKASADN
jgi:hypothetical protein